MLLSVNHIMRDVLTWLGLVVHLNTQLTNALLCDHLHSWTPHSPRMDYSSSTVIQTAKNRLERYSGDFQQWLVHSPDMDPMKHL